MKTFVEIYQPGTGETRRTQWPRRGSVPKIRVVTWNMHTRTWSWERLKSLQVEQRLGVALLQEAVRPPSGWTSPTFPPADAEWRVEASLSRTPGSSLCRESATQGADHS